MEASNLRGAGPLTAHQRLLRYLEWVTDAAGILQGQISAADVDRLIQTRRYYALLGACGTLAGSDQQRLVNGLVDQDLADRDAALGAALTTLSEHISRWGGPMWLVVADSSFYLNSPQPLAATDMHKLDSVGDLGASRCASMIGGHARAVSSSDSAAEVSVVASPSFWWA